MQPATYERRRENLRRMMREAGLPALLVTYAANRFYLSGFEHTDSQCNESAGYLLVTLSGDDYILTDPRFYDAAARLWPRERIFIYKVPKNASIRDFLKSFNFESLGFDPKSLCVESYLEFKEELNLRPAYGLIEGLRRFKDNDEIEAVRRSCNLNHAVFEEFARKFLLSGRTEEELAWEVDRLFREKGASDKSFDTIVAVNENAALPHAEPGGTVTTDNCLLLVDAGGILKNYCSDQTRTFWVGMKPTERFERCLELVKGAQQAALKIMRPGLPVSEAYKAAYDFFAAHGVAEYFTHALGHGIGLETHEPPSLNPKSTDVLQPGMVVTVEPGLYYPDWGGVRWEYMVLVTEDGIEIL